MSEQEDRVALNKWCFVRALCPGHETEEIRGKISKKKKSEELAKKL